MSKKKKQTKYEQLAAKLGVPPAELENVVMQLVNAAVTPPLTVAVTAHPQITRQPTITLPADLTPQLQLFLAKQLRIAAEILTDQALQHLSRSEDTDERDTARTPSDENRDEAG